MRLYVPTMATRVTIVTQCILNSLSMQFFLYYFYFKFKLLLKLQYASILRLGLVILKSLKLGPIVSYWNLATFILDDHMIVYMKKYWCQKLNLDENFDSTSKIKFKNLYNPIHPNPMQNCTKSVHQPSPRTLC